MRGARRPRLARSYLYVPAVAPEKMAKVLSRGAHAVIIDLEDSVPPARRQQARAMARAWLDELGSTPGVGTEIWVRVNPGTAGAEDLEAVLRPALSGVCVPKVGGPADLQVAQSALRDLGRWRPGAEPPSLMALIESASGVLHCEEVARCEGVARLQLGEYDLGAELGVEADTAGTAFLVARAHVVLASAAAGIAPPIAPVSAGFDDLEAFRASTEELKGLGFGGRACVHPAQVAVVNEVFSVAPEVLDRARRLLRAAEQATGQGTGAWRGPGGMVDQAMVRAAHRLLAEQGELPPHAR